MKDDLIRGVSMARQASLYREEKGPEATARQMELRRRELIERLAARRRWKR